MNIRKNLKLFSLFFLSLLFLVSAEWVSLWSNRSVYLDKVITKIEFKGNINTSSDDILELMDMRPGVQLSQGLLNADMRALFVSGFFYHIDIQGEADGEGVKILVIVKERPRVKDIDFIGADEVFPSDLRDKIPLKENEVITPKKVTLSKEVILKKYRDEGFFLAYVRFETEPVNPETNTVKVKFIIDEGEEIPVSKINIFGNNEIDTYDIQGIMDLKESGIIESGVFKESAFESDKQKIAAYLKSRGYVDAEISNEGTNWEIRWENPKKKDKRVVIVNFKIIEGEQYFYNGYTTNHDLTIAPNGMPQFLNKENNPSGTPKDEWAPVYPVKFLEDQYEFAPADVGEVFDETKFQKDRASINEAYSAKGYLFAQVIPRRKVVELSDASLSRYENCEKRGNSDAVSDCNEEYNRLNVARLRKIYEEEPKLRGKKFIHVDFTIRENNLAFIENIIIKGNKKTQDRVIRRELLFKPGDLFNSSLVNRSRERIFNLGYFKEVNFNMRPGSDETKMNLIIELVEQPTGTVSMGGGYGTITGFSIFTQLGENNLNGTGQQITGRVEFGPIRRYLQISWTEPWFLDKPWSLTLSAFYSSRTLFVGATSITENNNQGIKEVASYERSGVGVSAGIGHRFLINWTHFHRYSPSFFASTRPTSLVSDQVLAEVDRGWQFRSQLTNGIAYDSRDNVFNSTQGFNLIFSVDNVGQFLGGESHFDQFSPILEYYHTWFDYTFFGLIRKNALRRWRVVQQFRTSSVFTFERTPKYRNQDKERIPYIQVQDRLFLGGYESLRGWFFDDKYYPDEWKDGAASRVLFTSELRFPIEPSLLWFVIFFDAGSMYEQINRAVGERKEFFKNYDNLVAAQRFSEPIETYLFENYNSFGKKIPDSPLVVNDPGNLVLSSKNLSMSNFRFSWGFGLRIQIPVLPLRLYFAQRIRYTGVEDRPFGLYPDNNSFQFVFGIGDMRF
ncbi:BamA/OMP85 family outer membrane protein [Leptospira biflexa]|uniref:BamA/OMP85 family outer membrane protein n=1 Tax=Leptospira biflexa TaxID=172 RepID=UPI0010834B7A|nr:outer membrane protein assembly factor [Leptospira biflexa]TGM34403.1 outer membrane protein assembly factor [Leptospira biflexa]TGM39943.1 outer membrane protein assembly factor [Leptospira biflexa]TGM54340.1 outer membrane protein assembly factor [Leptospira biflexa]